MTLGAVLWMAGYADQAQAQTELSLSWAREIHHINSVSLAHFYLGALYAQQGDRARTIATIDELTALADRYGLPFSKSTGLLLRCWATHDVEQSRQIIEDAWASGEILGMTAHRGLLADSAAALGRFDEAIEEIREAMRLVDEIGERFNLAELYRLEGTILLLRDPSAAGAASESFRGAIEIARAQGAKMLELKAATALCQLLLERGQRAEAQRLLAPVYGWFTEGFDAPPLREARNLLAQLGS
jgi:tetratricopeptide (TPR) repeat protein